MNTMMATSLCKISVIYMIIIIMNECQFANTKDTKKDCAGWILNDGYKEYSFKHNQDLAKQRSTQFRGRDDISIFSLVYGEYIETLNFGILDNIAIMLLHLNITKPSAFCERIGVQSEHPVVYATPFTRYDCPGWIEYYGYSTADGDAEANWDMAKILSKMSLDKFKNGEKILYHYYTHGITRRYIQELLNIRDRQNAISVQDFCEIYFGDFLYPFDTGKVTKSNGVDRPGTEIPKSTITAGESSYYNPDDGSGLD